MFPRYNKFKNFKKNTSVAKGLDGKKLQMWVEVHDEVEHELPSSLTVLNGGIGNGGLESTWYKDGSYLVIDEQAGGNPGFWIQFDFTDEDQDLTSPVLHFVGKYVGNVAHNVKLQQWNFTGSSWNDVTANTTDISSGATGQNLQWTLLKTAGYISNGSIRVSFKHTSVGAALHEFSIDNLWLS